MEYNPQKNKYDVLIVDDIPENIQILASILTHHNIDVSFAINGIQTLQTIKFKPPDLILLDVSMPMMDGFEICEKIHSNPVTQDIPVIFLTARSQKEDIIKGFEVGAVDYITKPFNSKELLSRVFAHLKLRRAQETINEQNKLLSKKNENITKSLAYAKTIQEAMLPSIDKIDTILDNYFIMYQPKDIVSGDFYWIANQDDKIIIAIVDSTGHGVPGAFMSIIGTSLLNEIVIDKKITQPNIILSELNTGVNNALHTKNMNDGFQHDGMDASVCVINKMQNKLEISSANHLLYYFSNGKMNTIEGDIFCIGGLLSLGNVIDYELHAFNLNEIDSIYMFSDGYQDQFGGLDNKKFMLGNFKDLLDEIHNFDIIKQEEILVKKFLDWKGDNNQVDDVLVFGLKL